MRSLTCILAAIVIPVCCGSLRAQIITAVAPPNESGPLPVAFAGEQTSGIRMDISDDGQYLLASTMREAKVWKLPEGTLIYRYQSGSGKEDKNGVFSQRFSAQPLFITDDGKYLFLSKNGMRQASEAVELASGERVPNGPLLDSLKAGKYRQTTTLLDLSVEKTALPVPRDFDNGGRLEPAGLVGVAPDIQHPGEAIVCFRQEYCGSKNWIKEKTKYSVKELRALQKERRHCQFYDYHIARYNLATGKATHLATLPYGVEQIDYYKMLATPSPFGDVVYVNVLPFKDQQGTPQAVVTTEGKELWRIGADEQGREFQRFDNYGNLVFHQTDTKGIVSVITLRPENGVEVSRYILPAGVAYLQLIAQWDMYTVARQNVDGNWTIALYSITDGTRMAMLTDEAGALAFAKKYRQQVDAEATAYQNILRAREQAWQNNVRAAAAYKQEVAANTAAHAKNFMPCPKCDGMGYSAKSGYSPGSSKTTTGVQVVNGRYTNVATTTTTAGGSYTSYEMCPVCKGRREVPRR
ncbi:hypothetical protein [Hymenobacter actinosclerus]|uniref:WD40-like Beta Propeller Repeat n=1 Tax=Hymenobacter actinosclerus TaxID=82805 RepID=A0A1H9YSS7_9BACT|nr:hypothetical protein [Hymenobacter actinosclerus]SES72213.1 hypothetical protein SAMN04487998_0077 [Hymenobacter actinosclerus]